MKDARRIIPCLDIRDGRLVKGVNFKDIEDIGDPVEAAKLYEVAGADEIVFLDIGASSSTRGIMLDLIFKIRKTIDIPLVVGGGVKAIEDIKPLVDIGVDKVSISSAAVQNPDLVAEAANKFGQSSVVVAIDAKMRDASGWDVYISGGTDNTGLDVLPWAKRLEGLGAGEILLTSMDRDGTNEGYDIDLTKSVVDAVGIPVIASGGAGSYEHFYDVIDKAGADAVLAASLFHFRKIDISMLKEYLSKKDIPICIKGDM